MLLPWVLWHHRAGTGLTQIPGFPSGPVDSCSCPSQVCFLFLAGLLGTQRLPRFSKLDSSEDISLRSAPCSGAYWMPGSPCSRRPTSLGLAQYTLDPVTSSAQKLQHRGSSRSRRRDSLLSLPPPCQVGHCVLQPRTLWFSPFPVFSHPVHGRRSL